MHGETLISWIIHQNKTKNPQDYPPMGVHKYSMMRKEYKRDIEVMLNEGELWFDNEGALAFLYKETLVLTLKAPKNIKYPWYKLDRSRSTPKIASNIKIT
jgi:hypothetical protein